MKKIFHNYDIINQHIKLYLMIWEQKMREYIFDNITVDDFDSFYEVMKGSFPSIEIRDYQGQKNLFDNTMYNVIGYKDKEQKVCAFLAFWRFEDFNFIEHFAVDDNLRGNGIGTSLFRNYLNSNSNNEKLTLLEVELPEDDISLRRIKYYERMGMKLNDYDYLQPPLQDGKPFFPLKIMSYGKKIEQDEFKVIKDNIYREVYRQNI